MSLSEVSPLVGDWIGQRLMWHYVFDTRPNAFVIPAGGSVQLPSEGYTFEGHEGVLIAFGASFDSPLCGIRIEANPDLTTEDFYTVNQMAALGMVNMPLPFAGFMPPQTPAGVFMIHTVKEWGWTEWLRLWAFNGDTANAHNCSLAWWVVAILDEVRALPVLPGEPGGPPKPEPPPEDDPPGEVTWRIGRRLR